ncbi:hypothetical protein F5883DRAFT_194651 [Diaporthe sp. PMI_573]|nr:hypothetical protein F5883DRAFT_194651 [Diaporthaceae sp. PMI_573]
MLTPYIVGAALVSLLRRTVPPSPPSCDLLSSGCSFSSGLPSSGVPSDAGIPPSLCVSRVTVDSETATPGAPSAAPSSSSVAWLTEPPVRAVGAAASCAWSHRAGPSGLRVCARNISGSGCELLVASAGPSSRLAAAAVKTAVLDGIILVSAGLRPPGRVALCSQYEMPL